MSGTLVFDKKLFMEQMDKFVNDDEYVIFSNIPQGSFNAASKKIPAKRIGLAFSASVFKTPDSIADVLSMKIGGLLVCKWDALSANMQRQIKEYNDEKGKGEQIKKDLKKVLEGGR